MVKHSRCCPARATARQFLYHRHWANTHNKEYCGKTILASYYTPDGRCAPATSRQATESLRHHTALAAAHTGIGPDGISARSLRAGGAMALLCAEVDPCNIKLLARWNSDSMMEYLHQQAQPIFARLAERMLSNGAYSFLPTEWVPYAPRTARTA